MCMRECMHVCLLVWSYVFICMCVHGLVETELGTGIHTYMASCLSTELSYLGFFECLHFVEFSFSQNRQSMIVQCRSSNETVT